jgi:cytochrome c oxidase assembly protein subunit 15
MGHRVGAFLVFLAVGSLAIRLLATRDARRLGIVVSVLLLTQIALGILNVVLTLPLPVATAHNGTGALLLLGVIAVNYRSFRSEVPR